MLHRDSENGYLMISQPAHAWVSGQLAAAWGNEVYGQVQPRQEVCLAAEQHDIGWLEWEANPTLNPQTGRPRTFRELPTREHVSVWEPAGPMSLVYGPYVALLVSMHGTGLYQHHDFERDNEDEADAARRFVINGAAFEDHLMAMLAGMSRYADFIDPGNLARNRRLVAVWDAISLFLCGGLQEPREITSVPAAEGTVSLNLLPDSANLDLITVSPWPFSAEQLELVCAGRWIDESFASQREMQEAIERAPWKSIQMTLLPKSVQA